VLNSLVELEPDDYLASGCDFKPTLIQAHGVPRDLSRISHNIHPKKRASGNLERRSVVYKKEGIISTKHEPPSGDYCMF
jgi:hypothetical protein